MLMQLGKHESHDLISFDWNVGFIYDNLYKNLIIKVELCIVNILIATLYLEDNAILTIS